MNNVPLRTNPALSNYFLLDEKIRFPGKVEQSADRHDLEIAS